MRVVINGRFLDRPITGTERFAREVVRGIAQLIDEQHQSVSGMTIEIARPPSDNPPFLPGIAEHRFGRRRGQWWEQVDLPRHARGAVILNLCNMAPLAHGRNVVCVLDAHPWLIPENFSWKFRRWYDLMIPRVIARSRRWTTISNYCAQQLCDLRIARRPPDRITYCAADNLEEVAATDQPSTASAMLPSQPYVLSLGSRSKNKNIDLVIAMADRLAPFGIRTVVAGGSASRVFGAQGIAAPAVVETGRISDDDLVALYRNALAFVFPSFFEGFGIPPIEAMKLDCPVVASNTSAMPEVLGDAAILLDPTSVDAWVDAVRRIHDDDLHRNTLIGKGREHADRYHWRDASLAFVELAREVAEQR